MLRAADVDAAVGDRPPQIADEVLRVIAGIDDAVILPDQLLARVAGYLHELVVDVRDPTGDVGRGHDRGVIDGAFQVREDEVRPDVLRVEAGQPWYPQDVDDSVILPETRLESLVSYTKGCYIGQEVIQRVKTYSEPPRMLVQFQIEGARPQEKVTAGADEIGHVTSGTFGPWVNKSIGMGYVTPAHTRPGTGIAVEIRGRPAQAAVVKLPFYKRSA